MSKKIKWSLLKGESTAAKWGHQQTDPHLHSYNFTSLLVLRLGSTTTNNQWQMILHTLWGRKKSKSNVMFIFPLIEVKWINKISGFKVKNIHLESFIFTVRSVHLYHHCLFLPSSFHFLLSDDHFMPQYVLSCSFAFPFFQLVSSCLFSLTSLLCCLANHWPKFLLLSWKNCLCLHRKKVFHTSFDSDLCYVYTGLF